MAVQSRESGQVVISKTLQEKIKRASTFNVARNFVLPKTSMDNFSFGFPQ